MELLLWNEDEYFHYSQLFSEPIARDECQLQHIPGSYLLHFSDSFLLSMNVCRARVNVDNTLESPECTVDTYSSFFTKGGKGVNYPLF